MLGKMKVKRRKPLRRNNEHVRADSGARSTESRITFDTPFRVAWVKRLFEKRDACFQLARSIKERCDLA